MMSSLDTKLSFAAIALGISSIITQIVLIREFLSVYLGSELVLGIIIGFWLLVSAFGSLLGRFITRNKKLIPVTILLQIIIAFLPVLTVVSVRCFKNVFFESGELLSITAVVISTFLILLPYCIISGAMFTVLSSSFFVKGRESISKVYYLDTFGSVIGGVLFTFLFIYILTTFQTLIFLMAVNLLSALYLSYDKSIKILRYLTIACFPFIITALIFPFDDITRSCQYDGQKIIFQKDTPYGNMVVTETDDQKNIYENGLLLHSDGDPVHAEEAVHYAMLQHDNPKNILLLSGGISGLINEILKYPNTTCDFVEVNELIIELTKKIADISDDKRVNIINKDARFYLTQRNSDTDKDLYDVIIMDMPDPSTIQINRYYTLEFFVLIKSNLSKNGILGLSLTGSENYMSKEESDYTSSIYNSLKKEFENVLIIPGFRNYLLASNDKLIFSIVDKIDELGIENIYVNKYYYDEYTTERRSDLIFSAMNKSAEINQDFKPISYYHHLRYMINLFNTNLYIPAIIIIVIFLFIILRFNPVSLALFTGGFASTSAEIVLLISLQIIYGYIYSMLGIIITTFMFGLMLGTYFSSKKAGAEVSDRKKLKSYFFIIQILIMFYMLLLPTGINIINNSLIEFSPYIIGLFTFIISLIIGCQFTLGSILFSQKRTIVESSDTIAVAASETYSADLIGASLGGLLVSAVLVPLVGVFNVCYLCAALVALSFTINLFKQKSI